MLPQAKRFAKAMKASLIFSSTSHSINVQKVCTICLSRPAYILVARLHADPSARSSRSFCPKPSISSVRYPRSRTWANLFYSTSPASLKTGAHGSRDQIQNLELIRSPTATHLTVQQILHHRTGMIFLTVTHLYDIKRLLRQP